jgi:hypothetical protein
MSAVTAAKSTIDRLLSNGNASATSGLIRVEEADETLDGKVLWKIWYYTESFSGTGISVNYRREGRAWIYTVMSDATDSAFFSKTGTARTLREARLEALTAMVAGCTAQAGKAENSIKEELLELMQCDPEAPLKALFKDGLVEERRSACAATIKAVLDSGLLPDELRDQWKARLLERLALREPEEDEEIPGGLLWLNRLASEGDAWKASNYATRGAVWCRYHSILDLAKHYAALNAEREQQHRDLLALINEM